jgi:hypothetical protein
MKRSMKATGIMIMLIASCSLSISAQRGMRGMPDSTWMKRPGRDMGMRQMRPPQEKGDSMFMKHMHGDYMGNQFRGGMRGMGPGTDFMRHPGDYNYMRGMRDMREFGNDRYGMRGREFQSDRFGTRPPANGMMRIGSLPGLTDKQKADITALREKQFADMKKMREEFASKMQAMRDDNMKKITNLLTDEQKKQLEAPHGESKPLPKTK